VSTAIDANILLYASDENSTFHERSRSLLEELAVGPALLYLFWPVVMAYLRIATHPRIFDNPLPPDAARLNIESLLERPHVRTPGEDDGFWRTFGLVTSDVPARGNLVPDAHLVALMHQHGVHTIWSHDRDLRKFREIRVRDPFT
jgi:toxin-antitoxin system PIN domain toxin